jgi:hypothetical protein
MNGDSVAGTMKHVCPRLLRPSAVQLGRVRELLRNFTMVSW